MLTANLRMPGLRLPTLGRKHWAAACLLAVMLGLYLVAGLNVLGVRAPDGRAVARVTPNLPAAVRAAPPKPEPLAFRDIAPRDAVALNAAVPISTAPNPAARPFKLVGIAETDRVRAVECLTSAIYYEAATEPVDGHRAVAQVVLNRVRHPAYPNSVCGVVYEGAQRATGCQFTFTCDGSLARAPVPSLWQRARVIAEAALAGRVYAPVGWATHYHTNWVVPYWSSSLVKAANVGTHIFYRWTGGWGTGPAFRTRHAGIEPDVRGLGRLDPKAATLAAGTVTEDLAGVTANGASAASIDSFQRAVLRRYEPANREGVAKVLAAQTRSGDAIPAVHRWALTGDGAGDKQKPLGKPAEAAPAPPACLQGVTRKTESGAAAVTC